MTHTDLKERKRELRREFRARLTAITATERAEASRATCERLAGSEVWRTARSLMLFVPLADELDLRSLIELAQSEGKEVALPRHRPASQDYEAALIREVARDLKAGKFGIPEPAGHCLAAPVNRLDLLLVPGLVFGRRGQRLGRGRGFYDRLLAGSAGAKCGVALDLQMIEDLPVEPHDILMDYVATPGAWVECGIARAMT